MLEKIAHSLGSINEGIGRAIAWLTTFLMLFMCFDVIRRYFFNETAVWITELEWHIFGLIFLLGAAYTFKWDKHVRVDLFYAKFSSKQKAWVNLLGIIFLLIPWCLIIITTSYHYSLNAYNINEASPDPGGLPMRYLIKFSITIGFVLLLIQAIAQLLHSLSIIVRKNEAIKEL